MKTSFKREGKRNLNLPVGRGFRIIQTKMRRVLATVLPRFHGHQTSSRFPVGRTVFSMSAESGKGHTRKFHCACDYDPHLLGLRLSVTGLAFQQQDLGVSACATTALWTSLQRARQLEQSANATPAQITMRASQFALPFGRPMPSEGLSLDQMCQAVQSLGCTPSLHRAESFEVTRGLVFSSVSSGISPVLIMDLPGEDISHAVAVAGIGVGETVPSLNSRDIASVCGHEGLVCPR